MDEFDRRRPAVFDLLLLVQERGGRQHDPVGVAHRIFQRARKRKGGADIVAGRKAAMHMASANPHLQHDRRVRGFGQLKGIAHRLHDRRDVGPRIDQPDLRLHRKRMRTLLHDGRAFAVVFADDDERTSGDAAGGQVGEGVGSDIDADGRFERDRAADRIHHGGGQRRGGGRLAGARFEMHAEIGENILCIRQHVHQMRDRRALVAGDVADAAFEQRLGDGEDAFAAKFLAGAQLEIFHLARKGAFCHARLLGRARNSERPY